MGRVVGLVPFAGGTTRGRDARRGDDRSGLSDAVREGETGEYVRPLAWADVLYWDVFGQTHLSGAANEMLLHLVEQRTLQERPLLLSSQYRGHAHAQKAIAGDRRKAFWFKVAGHLLACAAYVVFITGAIEGLALAPPEVHSNPLTGIFTRLGVLAWHSMNDTVPLLWSFLRSISPYPTERRPLCRGSFGLDALVP